MHHRKIARLERQELNKNPVKTANHEAAEKYVSTTDHHKFWSNVKIDDYATCWAWIKQPKAKYGKFYTHKKSINAHVVSFIIANGPFKAGLYIDHICKNKRCVNPAHLRAVTPYFNAVDNSDSPIAKNARKTHCKRGHEFTPENTRIKNLVERECRACHNLRQRVGYKSKKK